MTSYGPDVPLLLQSGIVSVCAYIGLYGIYLVLFTAAVLWTTCRRDSIAYRWLFVPLLLMFISVTTCLAFNMISFHFNVHYLIDDSKLPYSTRRLTLATSIILSTMACLAGVCSDGLLAWRCFVIFGKRRWVKWLLTTVLLLDFLLGVSSNIAFIDIIHLLGSQNTADVQRTQAVSLLSDEVSLSWAWYLFATNTAMTFSVMYNIVRAAVRTRCHTSDGHAVYVTAGRVIIESSMIAWVGQLLYCIAATRVVVVTPARITMVENIVLGMMLTILPVLLGISQTLIIVRAGLARYMRVHAPSSKHTAIAFAGCSDTEARTELVVNGKECHEDMELVTPQSESPRARPASLQTESERD